MEKTNMYQMFVGNLKGTNRPFERHGWKWENNFKTDHWETGLEDVCRTE